VSFGSVVTHSKPVEFSALFLSPYGRAATEAHTSIVITDKLFINIISGQAGIRDTIFLMMLRYKAKSWICWGFSHCLNSQAITSLLLRSGKAARAYRFSQKIGGL